MSTPPVTGPLCTRATLAEELRALGVRRGDTLFTHTSLSSLGWVCGGAETVVLALLDALGDEGTLVVPTHSSDNSDPAEWQHPPVPEEWWPLIRDAMPAYDPRTARVRGVGVVPETVRTWPGAVRSAHPQTSFAAVGARAKELMAEHALDCRLGERSPLAALEATGARVLLLGAGFDACTAFHLAEYRLPAPEVENSFAVMTDEGRRWLTVREPAISEERFDELGAAFEKERPVTRGLVGAATARLFPLPDAVAYARGWLAEHRPYTA
ncbi:SPBc2 prophage-derived aminoglycoside N(3')-acetyltransferase-like protein YokD [Streptomyces sp. YIM 121038]|uniref:aminoglycoside N(3)-acetyltransferase n=1 Tax=Streptomyces sp. YIM 121038 TaxID=2136401 RepID=UPI001110A0EF|nr:AAC(3) family N-acetyltransferase [Streptomyces sp. YIM 121038]QCX75836.1 SPBc2 prophage-derived aminoglycoside N(3')-acetyltransferase-like protein YokD [Streptomyces sp. YIM 121038]